MRKAHVDDTNQPDRVTDALISRGLIGADEGVGCPGPSLLAGIHEGSLEPDETERWMTHLAACQRCQAPLGSLARAEEDAQPSPALAGACPAGGALHRPGDASIIPGRDTVARGVQRRYRAHRRRRTELARSVHRAGARHCGSRAVGRRGLDGRRARIGLTHP